MTNKHIISRKNSKNLKYRWCRVCGYYKPRKTQFKGKRDICNDCEDLIQVTYEDTEDD